MCRHANEGKSTDWLNSINSSLKPKQTVFTHSHWKSSACVVSPETNWAINRKILLLKTSSSTEHSVKWTLHNEWFTSASSQTDFLVNHQNSASGVHFMGLTGAWLFYFWAILRLYLRFRQKGFWHNLPDLTNVNNPPKKIFTVQMNCENITNT